MFPSREEAEALSGGRDIYEIVDKAHYKPA